MARWRLANEHWYWPINVYTDEGEPTEEQKEINEALGIQPVQGTLNLWRCRHCAAMVPGDGRGMHLAFHRATNTVFIDINEVRKKE
jgi:hypothetical protein